MKPGINNLWPTPVLFDKVTNESVLNDFSNFVLHNYNFGNASGEFNNLDALNADHDSARLFKDEVVIPSFKKYLYELYKIDLNKDYPQARFNSWITGSTFGYTMPTHNHAGAHFSAVFYLFCEEKSSGGEIRFIDPRFNANRGYDDKFNDLFLPESVTPNNGEILIFPSFLYHEVRLFMGSLRLAMPVDLFLVNPNINYLNVLST